MRLPILVMVASIAIVASTGCNRTAPTSQASAATDEAKIRAGTELWTSA